MLLDAAHARERQLKVFVHPSTGMLKPKCFGLDTVHEDNAHPSESIRVEFARWQTNDVTPIEFLPR